MAYLFNFGKYARRVLLGGYDRKRGHGMTIEQAQKFLEEEYERAKRLEYIKYPLAYALYQVWKKADSERRMER